MVKNPENMSRDELLEQKRKIDELLESQRADTIDQLRAKWEQEAQDAGLSFFDVIGKSKPKAVTHALKGTTVPPKYRDKDGNEWTGRGQIPKVWKDLTLDEVKERFTISTEGKGKIARSGSGKPRG